MFSVHALVQSSSNFVTLFVTCLDVIMNVLLWLTVVYIQGLSKVHVVLRAKIFVLVSPRKSSCWYFLGNLHVGVSSDVK